MNLDALMAAQELFPYFHMLNGPTYVELVKDFWARAEVYDEKLQSIGIDASDDYFLQKLDEVRQIAGSVEDQVVEEAQEVLELIPEASVAAPVSTAVAEVSEAPVQVTQTSNLPLIIP